MYSTNEMQTPYVMDLLEDLVWVQWSSQTFIYVCLLVSVDP
jgi:hypothetical protein